MDNNREVPPQIKNRTILSMVQQSHVWVYVWRKWKQVMKGYLHSHIYCSIIYNSQGMEIP